MQDHLEDKFIDECGIFGMYSNHESISQILYLGLHTLQHRGQESAGIATFSKNQPFLSKGLGLIEQVFDKEALLHLKGGRGIGHVRYATTGEQSTANAQPLLYQDKEIQIAISHNGNLVNASRVRKNLENEGVLFQSTVDSEVLLYLIVQEIKKTKDLKKAIKNGLKQVSGAYSLLILTPKALIGIRDPQGFRPLCLGQLGDAYYLTSESCALNKVGANYIREVRPNEMIVIDDQGCESYDLDQKSKESSCVFELIYLSRPDSVVYGESIYLFRKRLGMMMAKEKTNPNLDLVIPVPDSGIAAAIGYSKSSGVPYDMGLLRNHYIGRTFIEAGTKKRQQKLKMKLSPVVEITRGQRIAVIDDSLVRGTTIREISSMLKSVGAKEVHILITSPLISHPCFYGINTPRKEELLGSHYEGNLKAMSQHLEVDSIQYLSIAGLKHVLKQTASYCLACFNGDYPVYPSDYIQLTD